MSRVRVLILSPQLWLGGAERLAVMYAEGLRRRDHEVILAYGSGRGHWFESRIESAVDVRHLTHRDLSPRSFGTWRRALRSLGREVQPDVIFAQSVTAAAVAAAA